MTHILPKEEPAFAARSRKAVILTFEVREMVNQLHETVRCGCGNDVTAWKIHRGKHACGQHGKVKQVLEKKFGPHHKPAIPQKSSS